jgi:hypothetical protein
VLTWIRVVSTVRVRVLGRSRWLPWLELPRALCLGDGALENGCLDRERTLSTFWRD